MEHGVGSTAAAAALRGAVGQLASGVALVMTMIEGAPHAATASSGVLVSVEPPLLAFFFANGSRMHRAMVTAEAFTASFLQASDYELARRFSQPGRMPGWPGLAGLDPVCRGPLPPLLPRAVAWFDCRLHQAVLMGDHVCIVGEVVSCDRDPTAAPLLYYRGRFHSLGPPVIPAPWSALDRADLTADW